MSLLTKTLLFVVIILVFSCVSKKSTNKLLDFFEMFSYEYEDISAVLVLTEEGCPTCNRSFASLIENYINNPKAVCIVSAKGNKVDLSNFIDADQIILDMDNIFSKQHLTKGTASIFLTPSGLIDTVVEINAQSLKQDLDYISKRLKEH
ncbi:MAG: hypothetical protein JKY48_05715 [Flavobacteriales bacterium]|nr:hypothetical protein [Flavobacteriales bacterium]